MMMRSARFNRDKMLESAKEMNELVQNLHQPHFGSSSLVDENFNSQNIIHHEKYMRYKTKLKEKFFDKQIFKVTQPQSAFKGQPQSHLQDSQGFLSIKTSIKKRNIGTSPMPSAQRSLSSNKPRAKSQRNRRYDLKEESYNLWQSNRNDKDISKTNTSLSSKYALYSLQLDRVMQKSDHARRKPNSLRKNLVTLTDRKRKEEQIYKEEKERIINRLLEEDIAELFSSCAKYPTLLNPQERKLKYEEVKRKELSNLEKYSLSFTSYLRQKTMSNIEKGVYDDKIRKKSTQIQKFHAFILEEAKISDEIKSKLDRVFKGIEHEFRRAERSKQMRLK